jgi:hypothetical protein
MNIANNLMGPRLSMKFNRNNLGCCLTMGMAFMIYLLYYVW